ncbi:MAG: MBL fold metallo-hydrolase [Chitinophagia bacterium]|nr:MBL fold metallo-hydrolase [Chitinophagia bacterium]
MKITPLSEGSFTIDHTKVFVPFDTEKDDLQQRPRGSLLVEIQPFLIETSRDLILLDAGLGFSKNGVLQILENVTYVDAVTGQRQLCFPHAFHYVHRQELSFALEMGNKSYERDYIAILEGNDRVVLLEDEGVIDGYIRHQFSGGHSPFHQVFWLEEKGETIFFGGDEAPQLQQMLTRFVAKYDHDGKRAMELRQRWWELGKQEKWTFLFYHDIKSPFA